MARSSADRPAGEARKGSAETRESLMVQHVQARQRRDEAALGSEEYRAGAEEVARIEIAIAALTEAAPAS